MTPNELQDWILNDGLKKDIEHVVQLTTLSELDNVDPAPTINLAAEEIDWEPLILAGSILAKSSKRDHQEAALRIATGGMTLSKEVPVRDAAAVLMQKLGNHRAVALGEGRERIENDLPQRLGVSLRMETQRGVLENSVLVRSTGEQLQVNSFQREFWQGASEARTWLSASAPTASGKTYLVSKWLIDTLEVKEARVAVYLAPTRALVTEIETSLRETLAKAGNSEIEVTSLPLAVKFRDVATSGKSIIFVFTQERLHLLANALEEFFAVDLLVVDEAHKIGDNQRGVVLQDAVERLSRTNPNLKAVFISPATQNPGELLADAPDDVGKISIESDTPTVLQNVILADQVKFKPKRWRLSLRSGSDLLELGVLNVQSKPSDLKKRLAFIAAAVGERGGTLVYTNGAAEAEAVALLISQLVENEDEPESELRDLADLIRKCVHKKYQLANLVEKGVGFHYGNMPTLVRMEVERLFREGKIKFLVCTSTLIEGVNLSCRTIVVRAPKKGKSTPMAPHDFWNLAGRAGRWGNEFQGNIVCINPDDPAAWPQGVPERAKYPIRRETDSVLFRGDELQDFLASHADIPETDIKKAAKFEQVAAYLLSTHLRLGSIRSAEFAKRHEVQKIKELDTQLEKIVRKIDIPTELAIKHPGVSAMSLQRLLAEFRKYRNDDIEDVIPAPIESVDVYHSYTSIMERINRFLFPAFLPETLVPLHTLIMMEWLKGYSLATIIRRRIEYHRRNGQDVDVAKVIRNTMELIEQTARFRAPKYFAAYIDVLKFHLNETGQDDLIEDDLDMGLALEFGVSSLTLMSLMELGLSRISAVALYEKIAMDNFDRNDCIEWVAEREAELDAMEIPKIVVREVREKVLNAPIRK